MKIHILRVSSVLVVLLLLTSARGESPACRMIELEIGGIDQAGAFHSVFNFGQALPAGTKWSTSQDHAEGTLEAAVTWENELDSSTPTVSLTIKPKTEGTATGTLKLEKLLWNSLYGPEPVLTAEKKPFSLPAVGSLFAVAAVSPVECSEPAG